MDNSSAKRRIEPRFIHIVVVEDNSGDVFLLEKALKDRHITYELTCYEDGEQAVRELQKDDHTIPDLVLLDLNLPRRQGFDVLRIVRNKPSFVGVPIGILTSSDSAWDRHRVGLLGAERYIHKPPTLDEFLEQVGQAIEEMLRSVGG